jgi:hypothetical protein
MKKATVTYTAPKGDNKVVEMMGHTFFDGKGTEVVCDEHQMAKLQGNQHFKVGSVSDYTPPPPKPDKDDEPAEKPEGKADHKAETHRR